MDIKIKFGIISLVVIIFQSILKIYGILLTGSLSFLSETIDTIVDIGFASLTLYSVYISMKPADYEHMYGHSKVDPVGAMIQGIILMNLYGFLIFNAIQVLIKGQYTVNNPDSGLVILMISFLINIIFSRIIIWQAKKNKSLTLEIQGLNMFQDSLRAVIVFISFLFILFGITFLDIIFSIILSIWIIIGAFKLTREGIRELIDVNPFSELMVENLRVRIFNLGNVKAVHEVKLRASGSQLFIDVRLSVMDKISMVKAYEITKKIRALGEELFPKYEVETLIEMNPLSEDSSSKENLFDLIDKILQQIPELLKIIDLNLFSIKNHRNLSATIVVDNSLTLEQAHDACSNFEKILKEKSPDLDRIITHIEPQRAFSRSLPEESICYEIDDDTIKLIKEMVEEVLRKEKFNLKGFHNFEFWGAENFCMIELHVFFDGKMNISEVHNLVSKIEFEIREKLQIQNLRQILLHSEPLKENLSDDVIIFTKNKK